MKISVLSKTLVFVDWGRQVQEVLNFNASSFSWKLSVGRGREETKELGWKKKFKWEE